MPGNDQRGPCHRSPAADYTTNAATLPPLADLSPRDALVQMILALGPDQLYAAGLGWRLGRLDAEDIAKEQIAEAGRDVAASAQWRSIGRQPRWTELQRRRGECVRRHRLETCTCARGGGE